MEDYAEYFMLQLSGSNVEGFNEHVNPRERAVWNYQGYAASLRLFSSHDDIVTAKARYDHWLDRVGVLNL